MSACRLVIPLLLAPLALPATADARFRAPCRPGTTGGPKCFWWKVHVRLVADGDTVRVKIPGEGVHDIRFTGINAPEIRRYAHNPAKRRGACHAVAAANFVNDYVNRGGRFVYLAARKVSSRSGHRLRRSVYVKLEGQLVDVAAAELTAGLALWLPNKAERTHNGEYARLARAALRAQIGLYDPDACGTGPAQDVPLRVHVHWNARGEDADHINSEWVDIRNTGDREISLAGWFVRDSALRRDPGHRQPGHVLPRGTVLRAHRRIRVRAGCGRDSQRTFHWCLHEAIFENTGDGAYLFDPDGDLRAADIYG